MSDVSNNTAELKKMAKTLEQADIQTKVVDKVKGLEIPVIAWPLMSAFGAASAYGQLRDAVEEASKGLDTVTKALGRATHSIASYYERMEQQHGKDFDTYDLK